MSLGVKSLWRAQSRLGVQALSLVPRVSRNLRPGSLIQPRCRLSYSTDSPSPMAELGTPMVRKVETGKKMEKGPLQGEVGKGRSTSNPTAASPGRLFLRRKIKTQPLSSRVKPMITPIIQYPTKHAMKRSLGKHVLSKKRQALHEYYLEVLDKPPNNWRSTLDFMIRHTPKVGEILDFKIKIGKSAAAQARATLSDLDTNLWQMQQRHNCNVHIESGFFEDEPLVLNLSGSSVSIRGFLLELVRNTGKISVVKVLDPTLDISSLTFWGDNSAEGQERIKLIGQGETTAEDELMTVYGTKNGFIEMAKQPKYKLYDLTTRADEIPRPAAWTRFSFEQYVAKLVLGRVPAHLHRSLYPLGSDHQSTVVHLLTKVFSSEDSRAAMSVTALKMALQFIHSRGPVFRPAARTISIQAEQQHLSLDAEVYHTFLVSASRRGDLQGFNSVMRAMHRKGHYVRAQTWIAFLQMIKEPQIKRYIMKKMTGRGLGSLQPVLAEMGRQEVVLELEYSANTELSIQRMVDAQDSKYGPSWLNAITLNRIIDILGGRENLEACHELLALISRDRRVQADQCTLNTMMAHTLSIPGKIALLSRLPGVRPDDTTYHKLFQPAWKQRLPNMLRVIWRYAVFSGRANSKMRHRLSVLMQHQLEWSKQRAFLKECEGIIFGRRELAACGIETGDDAGGKGIRRLVDLYIEDAGGQLPLVPLGTKLQEAYEMDMKIHKLKREGTDLSASVQDSLTVEIPLGMKEVLGHTDSGKASTMRRQLT
ncbi:hypothetical protein F5B22DRAFT_513516 [Xylaria bambusicola]|uniref:uncharacterized protein n=1 Tax=Xylaria bambusicola TaxID=326684 RepID=UPI0020083D0F|nr:uncharacterized protein F5B22DRAFT_513516 [Xylaria bambusicola]KAI0522009.1 hypothetical protein F5B22DRAFT_513516 [Xylaria bambusicola]